MHANANNQEKLNSEEYNSIMLFLQRSNFGIMMAMCMCHCLCYFFCTRTRRWGWWWRWQAENAAGCRCIWKGFSILLFSWFLFFSFSFRFSCPPASTCSSIHFDWLLFLFRFFHYSLFLTLWTYSIPDNFVVFFLCIQEKTRSWVLLSGCFELWFLHCDSKKLVFWLLVNGFGSPG